MSWNPRPPGDREHRRWALLAESVVPAFIHAFIHSLRQRPKVRAIRGTRGIQARKQSGSSCDRDSQCARLPPGARGGQRRSISDSGCSRDTSGGGPNLQQWGEETPTVPLRAPSIGCILVYGYDHCIDKYIITLVLSFILFFLSSSSFLIEFKYEWRLILFFSFLFL